MFFLGALSTPTAVLLPLPAPMNLTTAAPCVAVVVVLIKVRLLLHGLGSFRRKRRLPDAWSGRLGTVTSHVSSGRGSGCPTGGAAGRHGIRRRGRLLDFICLANDKEGGNRLGAIFVGVFVLHHGVADIDEASSSGAERSMTSSQEVSETVSHCGSTP